MDKLFTHPQQAAKDLMHLIHFGNDSGMTALITSDSKIVIDNNAIKSVQDIQSKFKRKYEIVNEEYSLVNENGSICFVAGKAEFALENSKDVKSINRSIACIFKTDTQPIELVFASVNTANLNLKNGKSVNIFEAANKFSEIAAENEFFQRQVEMYNTNAQGGIICFEDNIKTEFMYLNNGYLKLMNASENHIKERFDNQFLKTVHPDDRNMLIDKLFLSDNKKTIALEHRITELDGGFIWVSSHFQRMKLEGKDAIYCSMLDITSEKSTREKLKQSEERLKIILNHIDDIIFEWNFKEKKLFVSSQKDNINDEQLYNIDLDDFVNLRLIHPDYKEQFLRIGDRLQRGEDYIEEIALLQDVNGKYNWYKMRLTAIREEDNSVLKTIGIITNINKEKYENENLKAAAQTDALTGLYNKLTTQDLISQVLSGARTDGNHAFMIVDIDNFKDINDTRGHLYGDSVISDISSKLKTLFRKSDIVGRIGGDEFVMLLCNIPSRDFVDKKAQEIIKTCRQGTSFGQSKLTVSIGVSFYPEDGRTYQELYKNADHALYAAKSTGKNKYTFYQNNMEGYYSDVTEDKLRRGRINEDIKEYIFNTMYDANDINEAIPLVFKIVGNHYNISRIYAVESTREGFKLTFEWSAEGVRLLSEEFKRNNLQELELGDKSYFELFNSEGIFSCRSISEIHPYLANIYKKTNVYSFIQYAIKENDEIKGYVGFDECKHERTWTWEEINTLSFICKMFSVFILKNRAYQRIEESFRMNDAILNASNNYVYIVDSGYKLLYLNAKLNRIYPNMMGELCYKAFFNRQSPCEFCKLEESLKTDSLLRDVAEFSDRGLVLERTTSPYTSPGGFKACIINLYNITKHIRKA